MNSYFDVKFLQKRSPKYYETLLLHFFVQYLLCILILVAWLMCGEWGGAEGKSLIIRSLVYKNTTAQYHITYYKQSLV